MVENRQSNFKIELKNDNKKISISIGQSNFDAEEEILIKEELEKFSNILKETLNI